MLYNVVIIGAGVIGSMLARTLSRFNVSICVLEKENDVSCGASKANSGIIHGGFDPEPGTLKARLNADGVKKLYRAAKQLNVPFSNNGSLVCAFSSDENNALKELYQRGVKNRIKGLRILSGEKARKLEPRLSERVTGALLSPTAGIICPYELTVAAMGNAMDNGAHLKLNFKVTDIQKNGDEFVITSLKGESVRAKYLVNCAGVNSDIISHMVTGKSDFNIIPRKGEYVVLDKMEGTTVKHTVFQVPSKNGKGILVTPTVDRNLLVGPTAATVEEVEDTATTAEALSMVLDVSKKSVPDINFKNIITSFSGVRASEKGGDFIIEKNKEVENFINVAAIDSPGLTCCVSIAHYVRKLLIESGMSNKKNKNYRAKRNNMHFFKEMTDRQKSKYIKKHPEYGKVICRCENVTEGEVLQALRTNPRATDVDGIKRRTRSGMGRCQGGFCTPQLMRIISQECSVDMTRVTKKGEDSVMVTDRI